MAVIDGGSVGRDGRRVPPLSDIEFRARLLTESRLLHCPGPIAMHLEPLENLPRSVREFLSHYAMIVLSILTALALEQGLVRLEQHHQGERARQEIEQEIDLNRRQVENSLADTHRFIDTWNALLERTVADVRAGRATNESLLATIAQARENFGDSTPTLTTGAWDAAISSHAVDYLDHDELRRFSEHYAFQRDFSQALWRIVQDNITHSISEVSLPTLVGKADPVATIAMLNERTRVLSIMASQLRQMDESMRKTLGMPAPAPVPAVAASAAASR
jgi:hypothetical protein